VRGPRGCLTTSEEPYVCPQLITKRLSTYPLITCSEPYFTKGRPSMERTKVTEWPSVETTVNPATYERMAELHNERGVPITQLVRAALDKEYGAKPL
jgi:hypothetical protein